MSGGEGFDQTQVCVVGGGISGAILALKLARAGIEVVVLERLSLGEPLITAPGGIAETAASFPQMKKRWFPRLAWATQSEALEVRGLPDVPFGGVSLRPGAATLGRWQEVTGSSHFAPESFAPWMQEATRLLEPSATGQERPSSRHLVEIGVEALGLKATAGVPLISPQSLLLSLAEKAGARIYWRCFARRILLLGTGAVGLEFESASEGSATPIASTLSCSCVVVCAGTIGSVEILRRSRLLADGRRTTRSPSFQLGIRLTGSFVGVPQGDHGALLWPLYVQDLEGEGLTLAAVTGTPSGRTTDSGVVGMECFFSGRPTRGPLPGAKGGKQALSKLRRGIVTVAEILFASGAERVAIDGKKPWVFHRPEELDPFLRGQVGLRRPTLTARYPAGSILTGVDPERFAVSAEGELRGYSGVWLTGSSILPDGCTGPSDLPVATLAVLTADALIRRVI